MKSLLFLIVYLVGVSLIVSYIGMNMGYTVGAIDLDTGASVNTGIAPVDSLVYAANLIGVMLQCIGWTLPEEIFPLWANIFFIKTAFVGVIIGIVEMILP